MGGPCRQAAPAGNRPVVPLCQHTIATSASFSTPPSVMLPVLVHIAVYHSCGRLA